MLCSQSVLSVLRHVTEGAANERNDFMDQLWWIISVAAGAALAAFMTTLLLRPGRQAREADRLSRLQRDFHRQREQLSLIHI